MQQQQQQQQYEEQQQHLLKGQKQQQKNHQVIQHMYHVDSSSLSSIRSVTNSNGAKKEEQNKQNGEEVWNSHQQQSATTTGTTTTTTTTTSSQQKTALLMDSYGNPLFPRLYEMRLESRGFIDKSSERMTTIMKQTDEEFKHWRTNISTVINNDPSLKSITSTVNNSIKQFTNPDHYVQTSYGIGKFVDYRGSDAMYIVELPFGGMLYTRHVKSIQKKPKMRKQLTSLELNDAYMLSENTRLQQLKAECSRLGIPYDEKETPNKCFECLKEPPQEEEETSSSPPATSNTRSVGAALLSDGSGKPLFPRLYSFRQTGREILEQQTKMIQTQTQRALGQTQKQQTVNACLLCGSMTCQRHASPDFNKEGITVCSSCVKDLEYDFNDASAENGTGDDAIILSEDLKVRVRRLVELYSRALLLLQYASQFMLSTASSLEETTKQHNEIIGVGGSSAGLVSSVLGVAAACTILTPAGPPLLVASLVFGGSATAVQTGSEAYKYYSEPNQLANRTLALNGIIQTILSTTKFMRDSTLVPYLDDAILELMKDENDEGSLQEIDGNGVVVAGGDAGATALRAGTRFTGTAATGVAGGIAVAAQEGAMAGRFMSRATTAAARTARFARFAGGALSAATLVLEAKQLQHTMEQIKMGNPCEKAAALRKVHADINKLPSTTVVDNMCRTYIKVRTMQLFQQAMTIAGAIQSRRAAALGGQEDLLVVVEEVVSTLEATQPQQQHQQKQQEQAPVEKPEIATTQQTVTTTTEQTQRTQTAKFRSKKALLERVKRFKEREQAAVKLELQQEQQ